MRREDAARIAAGLCVLLLPFFGTYSVIPLSAIGYIERRTRILCISLSAILLIRSVLVLTHISLPLYVAAVAFVPPTFAYLASRRFDRLAGSLVYLAASVALGYPAAYLTSVGLLPEKILFLSLLAGLSGAFLQHVSDERDFSVPFGCCMVMWLFSFDYPLPGMRWILLILAVGLSLGLGAYYAKAADVDAVLSETMVCVLVVLFAGFSWFILLLCFYVLGGWFTRFKYSYKKKLGIAQSKGGVRGYKNVYANSLIPMALAVLYGVYASPVYFYAFLGAVATANGDTLASEIGQTSRFSPRMITTLRPVATGVDGGVTPLGEAASFLGSMAIGIVAYAFGMTDAAGIVIATVAGFLGTNFDSFLGATLQQRGILSNNGVNLVATLFGAIAGAAMWWYFV
jgi:uncharacterized protein (TIGR00297 family)